MSILLDLQMYGNFSFYSIIAPLFRFSTMYLMYVLLKQNILKMLACINLKLCLKHVLNDINETIKYLPADYK